MLDAVPKFIEDMKQLKDADDQLYDLVVKDMIFYVSDCIKNRDRDIGPVMMVAGSVINKMNGETS